MTVFGISKYSGGGMLITDYKDSSDGLLDITIVKNLTFIDLIINLKKLYTGMLIKHPKVTTLTTNELKITPSDLKNIYIQADEEFIGTGEVNITICKQAIQFIIP